MRISLIVALVVCSASPAFAGNLKLPALTLIAAQSADLVSTHHALNTGRGYESNTLMQGSDSKRVAMKAATTAGTIWLMQKLSQSHPKAAQVTLYALSGTIGLIAVRNAQIARR